MKHPPNCAVSKRREATCVSRLRLENFASVVTVSGNRVRHVSSGYRLRRLPCSAPGALFCGLAFTFAAYVLYDLARLLQWPVEGALLSGLFLLATVTALVAVWALYWEGRKS